MKKLPTPVTPTYTLKLPSTGETLSFRPFLTQEEKILLLALESEDPEQIKQSIIDIITNCTEGKINPRELPVFDIEYIFLQLRSKSVGETCEPTFELEDENGVKHTITLKVPIDDIKVVVPENHNMDIKLNDELVIRMKYPTIESSMVEGKTNVEQIFNSIIDCVDTIFYGEEQFDREDLDPSDISEFIDKLERNQFAKLIDFMNTIPTVEKELDVKVGKKTHKIHLKGIQDFFV